MADEDEEDEEEAEGRRVGRKATLAGRGEQEGDPCFTKQTQGLIEGPVINVDPCGLVIDL